MLAFKTSMEVGSDNIPVTMFMENGMNSNLRYLFSKIHFTLNGNLYMNHFTHTQDSFCERTFLFIDFIYKMYIPLSLHFSTLLRATKAANGYII